MESIHDGERRASIAQSIRTDAMSDLDMSSIVDDRQFDFDDEITNAVAYRRALANLRNQGRFHEVTDDPQSPKSVDESEESTPPQGKAVEIGRSSRAQTDSSADEPHEDSTLSSAGLTAATSLSALDLEDPTFFTAEHETGQGRPHRYMDGTLVSLDPHVFEPKGSLVAETFVIDPTTGEVFDKTKPRRVRTDAQMRELEQKALASRGILPTITSRQAEMRTRDEIRAMMEEDKGRFGFSDVGGSVVTPAELKLDPTKFRKLKFVVLGDGAAGKTYAIMKYLRGHTDGIPYSATVYSNYTSDIRVDGYHCQITWEDTTGQEDFDRLRTIAYPDCHVALLIFAIDNPDSFANIKAKWATEIYQYHRDIPKIVVGCKIDLRNDQPTVERLAKNSQRPISREQGEQLARTLTQDVKAAGVQGTAKSKVKYMECSAFTGEGIKDLFEEAARLGLSYTDPDPNRKHRRISSLFKRSKSQQHIASIPEEDSKEDNNFRINTEMASSPIQ